MNRAALLAALLATVGSALLLAVGGQSPTTAITNPAPAQQWRRDSTYLRAVRDRGIPGTEGALFATATAVCRDLADGRTRGEAITHVEGQLGVPAPDAGYVVDQAVQARCPGRPHAGVPDQ